MSPLYLHPWSVVLVYGTSVSESPLLWSTPFIFSVLDKLMGWDVVNSDAPSLDNGTPCKWNKDGLTRSSLSLVVAPHSILVVLEGHCLIPKLVVPWDKLLLLNSLV